METPLLSPLLCHAEKAEARHDLPHALQIQLNVPILADAIGGERAIGQGDEPHPFSARRLSLNPTFPALSAHKPTLGTLPTRQENSSGTHRRNRRMHIELTFEQLTRHRSVAVRGPPPTSANPDDRMTRGAMVI